MRLRDRLALRGVTSNPVDLPGGAEELASTTRTCVRLAATGLDDRSVFHQLAIDDIRRACDVFAQVHERTGDGHVSIEVDPDLAHDTRRPPSNRRASCGARSTAPT